MDRRKSALLAAACGLCLFGLSLLSQYHTTCGEPVKGENYRSITAAEVVELSKKQAVYLLDVREEEELQTGILPAARHCPLSSLDSSLQSLSIPTDAVVVTYCASGVRSAKAARRLCQSGYHRVFNLGGIDNWTLLPPPTGKPPL